MPKHLTAAAVRRIRPGKTQREIRDGGCRGLLLLVQPSGHKSWAMRFSQRGRLRRIALGPVDVSGKTETTAAPQIGQLLTLAAARQLAMQLNRERASGHDVVAVRHREKLERQARGAATFAVAAQDFITQHAQRHTRDWEEQARLLGFDPLKDLQLIPKGLADRWRDEPISDINGDDIHGIVDEVREKGAPGLVRRSKRPTEARARAMMRTLSKMFGWLVAKRRLQSNPCDGVARPQPPRARDRVLTNAEIVKFWRASDAMRPEFGVLLQLLLLTGCREREVAEMRRTELRDDGVTWTISGTRTKNRREHIVPMPPLACELLASVPTAGDLIFTTDGAHPVSGWSKIKRRLDAAMKIPAWRLHDLRRTAATGMAELGIAPHIVEAVLNHVSGARASVAGTYNRAAYAEEKEAALARWASHVAGLVGGAPANITPLRARRA